MHLRRLWSSSVAPTRPCRCGHQGVAHEHYRSGSDCALCDCLSFTAVRPATRTPRVSGSPVLDLSMSRSTSGERGSRSVA